MSYHDAVPRQDTSRLIGGLSGVQQRLTPGSPEKKGLPEPAPLGGVGGEQWRAHSGVLSPPECQKIGLWGTLNQVVPVESKQSVTTRALAITKEE